MIQTEYMKMVGFIMKIQNMNNYKCEKPNNGFNFDRWAFTSNSLGRSAATVLLIERKYDSNPR
jgi:hypothetical protein